MLYKQGLGVMVFNTVDYISVRDVIQTRATVDYISGMLWYLTLSTIFQFVMLYKQRLGVMVFNTVDYISVRDVIQTRARGYGI